MSAESDEPLPTQPFVGSPSITPTIPATWTLTPSLTSATLAPTIIIAYADVGLLGLRVALGIQSTHGSNLLSSHTITFPDISEPILTSTTTSTSASTSPFTVQTYGVDGKPTLSVLILNGDLPSHVTTLLAHHISLACIHAQQVIILSSILGKQAQASGMKEGIVYQGIINPSSCSSSSPSSLPLIPNSVIFTCPFLAAFHLFARLSTVQHTFLITPTPRVRASTLSSSLRLVSPLLSHVSSLFGSSCHVSPDRVHALTATASAIKRWTEEDERQGITTGFYQ